MITPGTTDAPTGPQRNAFEAPLLGYLDVVGEAHIRGWACAAQFPAPPVHLRILADGAVIGEIVADRYRADLERAGIGAGRHGFEMTIPGGLSREYRHVVQVQRVSDGAELRNSPWIVEPAPALAACAGMLDSVTRDRLTGWAHDSSEPDEPVWLQILDNGALIVRIVANRYRADLERAGFGDGRRGFDIILPGGLSPRTRHVIAVRRERDGAEIGASPAVIEAADSFDAALEHAVTSAVAGLLAAPHAAERSRAFDFLVEQTEHLLAQRANADAQRSARLAYRRFHRRWGPHADKMAGVLDPGRRALVITKRIQDDTSAPPALRGQVRGLQKLGYQVSLAAAEALEQSAATSSAAGLLIWGKPFYAAIEDVLRRQADCIDVVYFHGGPIATRYLALARQFHPRARLLYGIATLDHVVLARQAAIEARPELLAASRRIRLAECTACWQADAVITQSAAEASLLRHAVPQARVHCIWWDQPLATTTLPVAGRDGVAFLGSDSEAADRDAADWLVREIMPLVWETDPTVMCWLSATTMPDHARRYAGQRVLALPGPLEQVRRRARLTVAPLRYGADTVGNVPASLAAGVPCVMSEVAAAALPLSPPLNRLVGHDTAALAGLILRLHAQEDHDAITAGWTLIGDLFSAERVAAALDAAIIGQLQPRQALSAGNIAAKTPAHQDLRRSGGEL